MLFFFFPVVDFFDEFHFHLLRKCPLFSFLFIYFYLTVHGNDFQVLCELPESYEAYRKQQHRWHSGPMQLFRLCLPAVITSKVH